MNLRAAPMMELCFEHGLELARRGFFDVALIQMFVLPVTRKLCPVCEQLRQSFDGGEGFEPGWAVDGGGVVE